MNAHAPTERLGASPATRDCLDLDALGQLPADPQRLAAALDQARTHADDVLEQRWRSGTDITELVHARAWVVEQLVLAVWATLGLASHQLALCAVGGFGRGELHPHSDVDLLILCRDLDGLDESAQRALTTFVQVLWDARLHPGHSVRTVNECLNQAREDVTVMTNLMDLRGLDGNSTLIDRLHHHLADETLWPSEVFFEAKKAEQAARYAQFEDTIYNLEPNLKEGPGGLRDVQMIAWVTQRHFNTTTLHGLVEHDFLSTDEHAELVSGRAYLWSLRWALHGLAGRGEERLLFDHQRHLARAFGFGHEGEETSNADVERFMQRYYRVAMRLARLNERLLQSFEEELLANRSHLPSGPIDDDFQITDGYLELIDSQAFVYRPILLIKMFNILAEHPEINGVRAATIRLVREHLYLIDDAFRQDPEVLLAFLTLLRSPQGVYHQLARMNRYGVLAALLPAFGQITGRMQFDLFHVYTVDQHTLFVIRNLRRFANGEYPDAFGHAIDVFAAIDRPELLYLAALFHDIAKGRGGDHSELGAEDAQGFCDALSLSAEDATLVVWLVREHLSMSLTSQREDISDPQVIQHFAQTVGRKRRLDYLYILTVADIAATSPTLWNSWKDSLLWQLYEATIEALTSRAGEPVGRAEQVDEAQRMALLQLSDHSPVAIEALWATLPVRAFIKLDQAQLVWTTASALSPADTPLVASRVDADKGVTELFVHARDFPGLFAVVTRELDRMQLNVLAARVMTTTDGLSWDVFQVMTAQGQPIGPRDTQRLERALTEQLRVGTVRPLPPRPVPRRLQPFMDQPIIDIQPRADGLTALAIQATDRPGLLSAIAETLVAHHCALADARIATFGQRVEDVFIIEMRPPKDPADESAWSALQAALQKQLEG